MNNCQKHDGKIKLGGYKNGRGYCGWYTNKDNKKLFLRSKKEFIYATFLDKNNQHFLTEQTIFEIDNVRYKPDFFIYDETYTKLIKIVEVKENKSKAEPYLKYIESFKKINIIYEVVYNTDVIKRKWVTKEELDYWTNQFVEHYPEYNMSGQLNPMFGVKHKESTKQKIGKKTREFFANPINKEVQRQKHLKFWQTDRGIEAKKIIAETVKKTIAKRFPKIKKVCQICNKEFYKTAANKNKTCSKSCTNKLIQITRKKSNYIPDGVKSYKARIIKSLLHIIPLLNELSYEDALLKCKKELKIIPLHFSMNLIVIEKYFQTLDNAIKIAKEYNGQTNKHKNK